MDSNEVRRLSRRDALRLAAAGSAAVATGSVLTNTTAAAPRSIRRASSIRHQTEQVTLRVLDWQSGGKDFWDKTDELFMTQNPGIKVEHEAVPYGQYFDKVGAYIAADDGPDLMQLEVGLGTLKYKDVLVPLDEHVQDIFDGINGTAAFCDNFDCSTDIYGVPHTNQGHMIYFNNAVFAQAGLDPANPPRTWTEFDAAAQQIKAAGKDVFAFGGKEWAALWTWCNLPHQTATVDELQGLYTGDVKWTDAPWKNTWVLFDDMVQRGWFPEGAAAMSVTPDAQDSFVRGDAAFFHSIISDAFNWKLWGDLMGYENFGVMKFPQIEANIPIEGVSPGPLAQTMDVHGGIAFSIPTWSERTTEAVTYIKFVLSPETQTRFLVEGGAFPSAKEFDTSVVDAPQFHQIVEWVNEPGTTAPGLLYCTPEEWNEITRQSQLMLLGQASPDDAAAALQQVQDLIRR